ncbi:hypothetical protein MMC07_004483 [Pseudocyphellaria aurata]|nr:hypothetical protein [Pseudocyphellaria aurata]
MPIGTRMLMADLRAIQARQDRVMQSFLEMPTMQPEPELVLNRATAMLAFICLLRLEPRGWTDRTIAHHLRRSFPEFSIEGPDVGHLFHATCRNRAGWVLEMRRGRDAHGRVLAELARGVLQTRLLADLPQFPPDPHPDGPRQAIRYLETLVGDRDEDEAEAAWVSSPRQ